MNKVVDKIKKLLLLSKNNSNINEATLAAAKAQDLIEKYNIALELIFEDENSEEQIIDYLDEFSVPFWKFNYEKWEILLAKAVAECNGCRVFTIDLTTNDKVYKNFLNIAGRLSDIEITKFLTLWLYTQINIILLKEKREDSTEDWCNDFRFGAITKITEKLQQSQSEARKEILSKIENAESAIVKLDSRLERVDQFLQNLNLLSGKKENTTSMNAFIKGYEAAEEIELQSKKMLEAKRKKFLE